MKQELFTVPEVAKVLGCKTHRARRLLKRSRVLFKVGGRWYTSRDKLQQYFPELLDAMLRRATVSDRE